MISPEKSFWFTCGVTVVSFVGLALEVLDIESPKLAYAFLVMALLFAAWAVYSYRESKRKFSFDVYSEITSGGSTDGDDVVREITVSSTLHSDKKFKCLNVVLAELQAVDNSLSVESIPLKVVENVRPDALEVIPLFKFRPLANELEILAAETSLKRQTKRGVYYFFSIQLTAKLFVYKKLSFFLKVNDDGYVDINTAEVMED